MHDQIEQLKGRIESKDYEGSVDILNEMMNSIVAGDRDLANEITTPATITELHHLIHKELKVPRKILQLRTRISSRPKRAVVFIKTMSAGIRKTKAVIDNGGTV